MACMSSRRAIGVFKALSEEVKGRFAQIPWGERASLFDLPDLGELWLYSNPITFRFDNIARAKGLYSLRLDSTNLASVSGIGSAPSLEFLDLRFNRLKGRFPKEILSLETLKTLSMGWRVVVRPYSLVGLVATAGWGREQLTCSTSRRLEINLVCSYHFPRR